LLNFIRAIKTRRIKWVGHAISMARRGMLKTVLLENLKERNHMKYIVVLWRPHETPRCTLETA
jgi:predicted acetyltransferase